MTLTFEQAGAQLGKMADRMETHVARGLSYGLEKHVREPAVIATVKVGVGRRLWGNKRAGAFAMFKREPIKMTGGKLITQIIVKGLPAMAETGGKTAAHVISSEANSLARRGQRLVAKGKHDKGAALLKGAAASKGRLLTMVVRGKRIAAPWVNHPGSRIAKNPAMSAALDAGETKVAAEIARSLDAFIAQVQQERA